MSGNDKTLTLIAGGVVTAAVITGITVLGFRQQTPPRPVIVAVTVTATARPGPTVTKTVTASPSPQAIATAALPPMPHVNGATHSMLVNCAIEQCTSLPGAGPNGGTCGPVVDNEQECVW